MTSTPEAGRDRYSAIPVWLLWGLRLVIAAGILVAAGFAYRRLLETAPKRDRRPVKERSVVVTTEAVFRSDKAVTVTATGTVVAARELSLRPRISGEVVGVHPGLEPGGIIAVGEHAVTLDTTDYELVVKQANDAIVQAQVKLRQAAARRAQADGQLTQARSQLVQARYNHTLELGKQDVARHEWDMLEDKESASQLDEALTLRKPHLEKALADISSAEAAVAIAESAVEDAEAGREAAKTSVTTAQTTLEEARLNLSRCAVKVPFDAVVLTRNVATGSQVTAQTEIAAVVAADAFWVEAALPVDRLAWVRLPTPEAAGATAIIRPTGAVAGSVTWHGRVIRRLPSLQEHGRRARVLIEVRDPLTSETMPLLLRSFVQVDIEGPTLPGVFEIPRESIRNGGDVWLRNAEGRLDVVGVETVWGDSDRVFVRAGLEDGQLLITSDLASPVPGMRVMLPEEAAEARRAESDAPPSGGSQQAANTPPARAGKGD